MAGQHIGFRDCFMKESEGILTVGNSKIKRTWKVADGGLIPRTLENPLSGEVFTKAGEAEAVGPFAAGEGEKIRKLILEGSEDDDFGFAKAHLHGSLTVEYDRFSVRYEFAVYPELPIVRMRIFIRGENVSLKNTATLDSVMLKEKHCEWENISIRAVTDSHNNLVREESGLFYLVGTEKLSGNIFRVHRTFQNDGIVFMKESPALEEQVRYPGYDFTVSATGISVYAAGFESGDLKKDEWVPLYGTALCLYCGDCSAFYRVLRDYAEARHKFQPKFDGAVYSNTWGDDNGGNKISEDFLQKDIMAAHDAGITHYQIDAGWDTGETDPETGRSLWRMKYSVLPFGLERIQKTARSCGMTIGLWFVPYTEDGHQYGCYREDAQTLAELYEKTGSSFFKLDGFKLPDYTTTYRFEKMLRLVLEKTNRSVFFNIDVTNWPRTGFFGCIQYGNVFVENRYTDRLSYYPHYTLRNVWMLSRYFPAYRFQAEYLNVSRNAEQYEKDEPGDMLAPNRCSQAYALASVLFACPLAWMEPSGLSSDAASSLKDLLNSVKDVREAVMRSFVLPVGDVPNGVNFTGFQAMESDVSGYLLFLREAGKESSFHCALYGCVGPGYRFSRIVSNCGDSVTADTGSGVSVSMDREFSYAVYRYEKKQ